MTKVRTIYNGSTIRVNSVENYYANNQIVFDLKTVQSGFNGAILSEESGLIIGATTLVFPEANDSNLEIMHLCANDESNERRLVQCAEKDTAMLGLSGLHIVSNNSALLQRLRQHSDFDSNGSIGSLVKQIG